MSVERWADIPGWEGWYQASDAGRVRSMPRTITKLDGQRAFWAGKVLCPGKTPKGYPLVALTRPGGKKQYAYVHRLVARTFLGECPAGLEVCHGDGSRDNNAVTNLRYDTRQANSRDRERHGTMNVPRGSANPNAKLKGLEQKVAFMARYRSNRSIGRLLGVSHAVIARVLRDRQTPPGNRV